MERYPENFQLIMDQLFDGLYIVDKDTRISYWNKSAERLSGFRSSEVIGRSVQEAVLMHQDGRTAETSEANDLVKRTLVDGKYRKADVFMNHQQGHRVPITLKVSPVRDDGGQVIGSVQIFSDNSDNINLRNRLMHLQRLAVLDSLTELGNRRYAERNVENLVNEYRRYGSGFGVMFVDIDHFKNVNDTFGHETGDKVLKAVARALTMNLRSFDIVSRWGGEEFVLLVKNITAEHLQALADKLRRIIEGQSIQIGGMTIQVTVSIGGACIQHGDTSTTIIDRADRLMYRAKGLGRNRVVVEC